MNQHAILTFIKAISPLPPLRQAYSKSLLETGREKVTSFSPTQNKSTAHFMRKEKATIVNIKATWLLHQCKSIHRQAQSSTLVSPAINSVCCVCGVQLITTSSNVPHLVKDHRISRLKDVLIIEANVLLIYAANSSLKSRDSRFLTFHLVKENKICSLQTLLIQKCQYQNTERVLCFHFHSGENQAIDIKAIHCFKKMNK